MRKGLRILVVCFIRDIEVGILIEGSLSRYRYVRSFSAKGNVVSEDPSFPENSLAINQIAWDTRSTPQTFINSIRNYGLRLAELVSGASIEILRTVITAVIALLSSKQSVNTLDSGVRYEY